MAASLLHSVVALVRAFRRISAGLASGMTRHGAMAAQRVTTHPTARRATSRALAMIVGSILIGLGVAMFARSGFGLPPYDVLLSVLRDRLGISLGQAGWALAALFVSSAAVLRQFPTGATLVYILLNGLTVDAALTVIERPDSLAIRAVFVLFGIGGIAGGISLVVHSGNPGGAFELLMRAGEARGRDPMRVRTALEVSLLFIGIATGGDFGPATVLFALAIGPVMSAGRQALDDHRTGRTQRVSQRLREREPADALR